MLRRYDVTRSSLALVACLVAFLGTYAALGDAGHVARYPVAGFFATAGLLAALLALLPNGVRWSGRRRGIALALAIVAAVAALPIGLSNIVYGCGLCGRELGFEPAVGIDHRIWIWAAVVLVPLLLGISAVERRRDGTPAAPEA